VAPQFQPVNGNNISQKTKKVNILAPNEKNGDFRPFLPVFPRRQPQTGIFEKYRRGNPAGKDV
jgi:hypothetical protein